MEPELNPYELLKSEFDKLETLLDNAIYDLEKERAETLKWKRVAQGFYKVWKQKRSVVENDMRTLTQISRRLESFSKGMADVTKPKPQSSNTLEQTDNT